MEILTLILTVTANPNTGPNPKLDPKPKPNPNQPTNILDNIRKKESMHTASRVAV